MPDPRIDPPSLPAPTALEHSSPTVQVVTLQVIHDLLKKRETENDLIQQQNKTLAANNEAIGSKIDALRAEGSKRGAEQAANMRLLEQQVSATRHEVRNLAQRVHIAEGEISDLRDNGSKALRQSAEFSLEHQQAIAGAKQHATQLSESFAAVHVEFQEVKENDTQQNDELAKNRRVNRAVCEVLGLDYDAVSMDPKSSNALAHRQDDPKPKATLPQTATNTKLAAVVSLFTFLALALQIVLKILGK